MSGAAMSPAQAIESAVRRNGHLIPGSTALTPFDVMAARESGAHTEEEQRIREEAISAWIGWLFEGGPDIRRVSQRLFTYARTYRPDLVFNMSMEQIAALFGQGRAAEQARTKRDLEGTLKKAGYRTTSLPTGKSPRARQKMAKAQTGNRHRARSVGAPVL
jgi:hypothetical protein